MAEKSILRQDVVQILFEMAGVENILNSEKALGGVKSALEQLKKDTGEAGNGFEEFGEKSSQSMMEMFAKSELLGNIADAGKEVLQAFTDCAEAAAEFEVSLAKLETIADTSSTSMGVLSDELLALSSDTGVAVTSLTESAYQAISASVDTASAVDFVAQANELAVGGFTSTETAVDVLSTAINAYGLEVSEAGQLSDYLITTQNLGKTSVDQLAQSVGKVIPLASAYNVEMDNLSSAYAILTANGIATAEATTYMKGMLNELADSGSSVAGVLQDETGMSFSELSASGKSLGEVLAIIGNSVDNDATAFSNLWSSQEAGIGALSLLNAGTEKYASVLDAMQNSTGAATKAYETMTDTAEYAQQRMTTAAENLKIAVGDGLLDTFTGFNEKGADALNWLTGFVQEHETLVSSLTVGVSVASLLTVGFLGLSVAITTVKAATDALNVSAGGTLKVVGLIVTGVSVLAGAMTAALGESEEAVEDYDGTLSECRAEIENTEAALQKAKKRYGENDAAVKDLEYDLETLNKQYEKGGGYIGELQEEIDAATESMDALQKSVRAQYDDIDAMNIGGLQAVSMLETLSEKANKTDADLSLMQSYADYLNDTFNCDIKVNLDTGELTGFDIDKTIEQIQAEYEEKKIETAVSIVTDPEFVRGYQTVYNNVKSLQGELGGLQSSSTGVWDRTLGLFLGSGSDTQIDAFQTDIEKLKSYNDEIQYAFELMGDDTGEAYSTYMESIIGCEDAIKGLSESADMLDLGFAPTTEELAAAERLQDLFITGSTVAFDELTDSTDDFSDALSDEEKGVSKARETITDYSDQLYELCEAYDEARKAALESIQDQYSAWDKVKEPVAMSASSIQEALQSQTKYWADYNDNLSALQEQAAGIEGLSDMLADVADGSEDSAAMLAGLAGASDTELQTIVDNWQSLQQQENDTADTMGDVASQFSTKTQKMKDDMQSLASDANMSEEFNTAASNTINTFFDTMLLTISERRGELDAALSGLMSAASSVNISISTPVEANASGTTNSASAFIAGEDGAELILDKAGSTVFPASETEKIIGAVSDYMDFSGGYTPDSMPAYSYNSATTYAPQFYLTLNGDTSKANQKQVKRWVQQAVDDAFDSVLRTSPSAYEI